jgi:hypothetical protein
MRRRTTANTVCVIQGDVLTFKFSFSNSFVLQNPSRTQSVVTLAAIFDDSAKQKHSSIKGDPAKTPF